MDIIGLFSLLLIVCGGIIYFSVKAYANKKLKKLKEEYENATEKTELTRDGFARTGTNPEFRRDSGFNPAKYVNEGKIKPSGRELLPSEPSVCPGENLPIPKPEYGTNERYDRTDQETPRIEKPRKKKRFSESRSKKMKERWKRRKGLGLKTLKEKENKSI